MRQVMVAFVVVGLCACTDDTLEEGHYQITVQRHGDDDCRIGWLAGDQAMIDLTIATYDGENDNVIAVVDKVSRGFLSGPNYVGEGRSFIGAFHDGHLVLRSPSELSAVADSCVYFGQLKLDADIGSDLVGRIDYMFSAATAGPPCVPLYGCSMYETFSGTLD